MADDKSELVNMVEKEAEQAEMVYHGCSRSTLYALNKYLGYIPDELIIASTALVAGCGTGGSCGAYCAGLLAIGLKYDPWIEEATSPEGQAKRALARAKEYEFRDAFIREFGSTLCADIQERLLGRSWSPMNPEELQEFLSLPGVHEKCAIVAGKGARLAAEILLRE